MVMERNNTTTPFIGLSHLSLFFFCSHLLTPHSTSRSGATHESLSALPHTPPPPSQLSPQRPQSHTSVGGPVHGRVSAVIHPGIQGVCGQGGLQQGPQHCGVATG